MEKYNLVLWGTGKRAEYCLKKGYFSQHNILCFVDSKKKNDKFHSFPIYLPDALGDWMQKADYLVILSQYYDECLKLCWAMHIDLTKIVITDNVQNVFFAECFSRLKNLSEKFYQEKSEESLCMIHPNLSDRVDTKSLLGRGKYSSRENATDYMIDYFRYRTFEFATREIKERNVPGALAELGVFRGDFASFINDTFPDRKLYLFDTFESFDMKEYMNEQAKGRCGEGDEFRIGHAATSEEILLSNLPKPENCVICKGLFPVSVTTEAEQEQFAFVSLDVDLEESTYQGLKFFFPRLSENGYIFLHDYTTHWLQGVKIAVKRYENDYGVILKKFR